MGILGRGATRAPLNSQDINDGIITSAKIAADAITSAKLPADSVGASELADDAVDTAAIAADAVDGGAKTDRDTVIDLIAQGGLQGDNLHLAVQAVRTALERVLIIADDAEGRIDTDTGVPAVVERGYQVAKGYYRVGHHIAVIAAGGNALRVVDIGLGEDGRKTTADFSSVQPGHTGGVAKQGAGVLGGG